MRTLVVAIALASVLAATAAGATNPRAEKMQLRPADVGLAKRAVLRQADVGPDWERIASPKNTNQFSCGSFRPDFSRFTVTGQASASFRFSSPPGAQIDTTVAVFKTKAHAAGDFRLGAKPQLADCFADQVRYAFRSYPAGVEGRLLSSRMVTAPKLGEHAAAYAISAELRGNGTVIPVFVDVVAVHRGRSIGALVFTGLGSRLPDRQYYASRVTSRLR